MEGEAPGAGHDQDHEAADDMILSKTEQDVERDPDDRRPDASAYAFRDGLRSRRASNIVFSPGERRTSNNID
ncbi:hypothetical protein EGY31_06255 [Burkholderia multivorans]|nr:hypothetical protein EGY31_06255 [Burkholderia multivorans]